MFSSLEAPRERSCLLAIPVFPGQVLGPVPAGAYSVLVHPGEANGACASSPFLLDIGGHDLHRVSWFQTPIFFSDNGAQTLQSTLSRLP